MIASAPAAGSRKPVRGRVKGSRIVVTISLRPQPPGYAEGQRERRALLPWGKSAIL